MMFVSCDRRIVRVLIRIAMSKLSSYKPYTNLLEDCRCIGARELPWQPFAGRSWLSGLVAAMH